MKGTQPPAQTERREDGDQWDAWSHVHSSICLTWVWPGEGGGQIVGHMGDACPKGQGQGGGQRSGQKLCPGPDVLRKTGQLALTLKAKEWHRISK